MTAEATGVPSSSSKPTATRTAPRFPAPRDSLAATFARLTREDLQDIVDVAIGELDRRDPDADIELNGDEGDRSATEDDYIDADLKLARGAGCPISDPAEVA